MIVDGKPDLVVAFPGGRGTRNMMKLAREYGLRLLEITSEGKGIETQPTLGIVA